MSQCLKVVGINIADVSEYCFYPMVDCPILYKYHQQCPNLTILKIFIDSNVEFRLLLLNAQTRTSNCGILFMVIAQRWENIEHCNRNFLSDSTLSLN